MAPLLSDDERNIILLLGEEDLYFRSPREWLAVCESASVPLSKVDSIVDFVAESGWNSPSRWPKPFNEEFDPADLPPAASLGPLTRSSRRRANAEYLRLTCIRNLQGTDNFTLAYPFVCGYGFPIPPSVDSLIAVLGDPEKKVARWASMCLTTMATNSVNEMLEYFARVVRGHLIRAWRWLPSERALDWAALTLAFCGEVALPELYQEIRHGNPRTRSLAEWTVGRIQQMELDRG